MRSAASKSFSMPWRKPRHVGAGCRHHHHHHCAVKDAWVETVLVELGLGARGSCGVGVVPKRLRTIPALTCNPRVIHKFFFCNFFLSPHAPPFRESHSSDLLQLLPQSRAWNQVLSFYDFQLRFPKDPHLKSVVIRTSKILHLQIHLNQPSLSAFPKAGTTSYGWRPPTRYRRWSRPRAWPRRMLRVTRPRGSKQIGDPPKTGS